MVTTAERRRLESAYPMPVDARPVLTVCAIGLLTVLIIAISAGILGGSPTDEVARVSAPQASNAR